jgi:hypothetical protein
LIGEVDIVSSVGLEAVPMGSQSGKLLKWSMCVALLFFPGLASEAQQPPSKGEKTTTATVQADDLGKRSFEALLRERDGLTSEIDGLTTEIYWVNDAIGKREEWKRLKTAQKPTSDIEKAIDTSLDNAHVLGVKYEDLEKQITVRNSAVSDKQQRKSNIDAELIRRADVVGPQQNFKLEMSLIFALLVGCVIIGFFVVAFRDEQVRREIFSGQAGIQFVTLFSLVIAIILFGIIDILEGKELAALLGGLSGYILGRSTTGTQTPVAAGTLSPVAGG